MLMPEALAGPSEKMHRKENGAPTSGRRRGRACR
jgi:hypothetical protein